MHFERLHFANIHARMISLERRVAGTVGVVVLLLAVEEEFPQSLGLMFVVVLQLSSGYCWQVEIESSQTVVIAQVVFLVSVFEMAHGECRETKTDANS